MAHANVFGLLAPSCTANARKTWNELLKDKNVDGFFDFYRTRNAHELQTRCSEMFLLERRGYLVHESLQADAVVLMDLLAESAQDRGLVDTVKNERGVLTGHFLADTSPSDILKIWMA